MANRIQYRRDTAANWTAANPILSLGEPGYETDTGKRKIGDGATAWATLAYQIDKPTADASYAPGGSPSAVTGGPFKGGYDRRLNIYNLKPYHLRKTRALLGLAAAGVGTCKIAFCGDSTTEGVGSGSAVLQNTMSWPAQFASLLNGKGYGVDGRGLVNCYPNNTGVWSQWSFSPALGTTNAYRQFNSGIGLAFIIATSTSSTATFTSDLAGTVADIYYLNSGGSFTYSIDGGAAVTVTPNGSQTVGVVTVTGLANATHTILITSTSANSQILGAMVRNSTTKGTFIYNSGLGGSKTADWIQSGAWYGQANLVANGWHPNLSFLMLGINDLNTGVTSSTYKANMQTLITTLKASGDLVLVTPVPGSGLDLTAYLQALYELADSNDVPLIDLVDRWKDQPTMNGYGLYYDTLHPNAGGYADLSRSVLNALAL